MAKAKALISRWDDDLSAAAALALSQGEMISPFGTHEVAGRLLHDFRGLNLDHRQLFQHQIQGVRLYDADFSEARIDTIGNRERVMIADCRFDKARFEGSLGVIVTDSSFRHARLDRVQFYSDSSFSDCDFSNANLYAARTFSSAFSRCRFDAANLSQASLIGCDFVDCSWEGVRFAGTSLIESWISLPGFPGPFDEQIAGEPDLSDGLDTLSADDLETLLGQDAEEKLLEMLPMPVLILKDVHWMDPAAPETLLSGSIRKRWEAERAQRQLEELQARQIPILTAAREAFRQGDYPKTLAQLAEAAALCPLPASGESLLKLARRRAGADSQP